MTKVLVVATSRKTRGGITSVVKAHEQGRQWKKFHCRWIETHRDGNAVRKLWYLITGLLEYVCLLPFYDVVHLHVATTQSSRRKSLFFYPAKWLGKKTIFHFHPSNEKFLYEEKNRKLYTRLFSQADRVLVLSEQWRRWIEDALGLTERIEILYNPCPTVNRREDLRKKQILFAGSIIRRKGYETLLRGFSKIVHKYPEWNLVFAGNGEIERAVSIAKDLGIMEQTQFLGWVRDEKKEKAFQESSIYCLASDGEGFPMGVLDAWAYGIPCIMTPVGGITDIVTDHKNGLLFSVGDIEALAAGLEELMDNPMLRREIVAHTDDYVAGMFEVQHINKELERIYLSLT